MGIVAAESGCDDLAEIGLAVAVSVLQGTGYRANCATHTPPWPTAIPEGIFRPSAKIVKRSALPSPSVSSRTLIRSRPGPALRRGYSRLSVIHTRPRSSKVIATGLTMSGSCGNHFDQETRRYGHRLGRFGCASRSIRGCILAVRNRLRCRGCRILTEGALQAQQLYQCGCENRCEKLSRDSRRCGSKGSRSAPRSGCSKCPPGSFPVIDDGAE